MTDTEKHAARWVAFRSAIANKDEEFIETMEGYFESRGIDKLTEQDIDNAADYAMEMKNESKR